MDALKNRAIECLKGYYADWMWGCLQNVALLDFSLVLDFLKIWAPNKLNTHADVRNKTISAAYMSAMSSLSSPIKCDFEAAPIPGSTDQSRWLENDHHIIRGDNLSNIASGNLSCECPAFQGYVGILDQPLGF